MNFRKKPWSSWAHGPPLLIYRWTLRSREPNTAEDRSHTPYTETASNPGSPYPSGHVYSGARLDSKAKPGPAPQCGTEGKTQGPLQVLLVPGKFV